MKPILLSTILFCAAATAYAQNPNPITAETMPKFEDVSKFAVPMASTPFKEATAIYIVTQDSAEVAFKKIGRALLAQGFTLANTDRDFFTLNTNPRPLPSIGVCAAQVVIEDAPTARVIVLRGLVGSVMAEVFVREGSKVQMPVKFGGSKSSLQGQSWQMLDAVAKAYPGGQVGYWSR